MKMEMLLMIAFTAVSLLLLAGGIEQVYAYTTH